MGWEIGGGGEAKDERKEGGGCGAVMCSCAHAEHER